jgi:hypothetical protein
MPTRTLRLLALTLLVSSVSMIHGAEGLNVPACDRVRFPPTPGSERAMVGAKVGKSDLLTLLPRDFDLEKEVAAQTHFIRRFREKSPDLQPCLECEWGEMKRQRPSDKGVVPSYQMEKTSGRAHVGGVDERDAAVRRGVAAPSWRAAPRRQVRAGSSDRARDGVDQGADRSRRIPRRNARFVLPSPIQRPGPSGRPTDPWRCD